MPCLHLYNCTDLPNGAGLTVNDKVGSDSADAGVEFEGEVVLVGVESHQLEVAGHAAGFFELVHTDDRR